MPLDLLGGKKMFQARISWKKHSKSLQVLTIQDNLKCSGSFSFQEGVVKLRRTPSVSLNSPCFIILMLTHIQEMLQIQRDGGSIKLSVLSA